MKKKTKKLTEEQKKKKRESAFRKKIRDTFTGMGFTYIPTLNIHFVVGNRTVELDYTFLYKNILIVCEDTTSASRDTEHILKKNEAAGELSNNLSEFVTILSELFPDRSQQLQKYNVDRLLFYNIYISQSEIDITEEDQKRFSNMVFWEPQTLAFFNRLVQCIKYSAIYELFRYLNIRDDEIGYSGSGGSKRTVKAPIIYPRDITGLRNGIRVVSFMMSAEDLLKTGYVLRKDNWETSAFLYQRLIEKEKIKGIRQFLAEKGEAFYNNVIVALPDGVQFEDSNGRIKSIEDIHDFQDCKLIVPAEMNSICIIDGQHRIFAHHEAPSSDKYESRIEPLRKQLHLLVTGLIFPAQMKTLERNKIQSEIFLDINDNTKKVAANVLTHIEMIKDPFSDIGLARRVLEKLNKKGVFLNRFELSALDENKIKVASIIKYALRYLVTLTPSENRSSFIDFWDGDKEALLSKEDEDALNEYIDFCARNLDIYFGAVRAAHKVEWGNPDSKILSIVSLNGFIIALNRSIRKEGLRDFNYYFDSFKNLGISFTREDFQLTASQYHMFSNTILKNAFAFSEEELDTY